jgi:hypothetical protein
MKTTILFIILSTLNLSVFSQKEDIKYASFNIISSGIASGTIACFHKPKNQSLRKTFINSFWKGCLGGTINFSSKKLLKESIYKNSYGFVWPSKILNSIGSSIIDNGSKNEKIFSSISMEIFFTNLKYDGKLHCQIDPFTLSSAIVSTFSKNITFNPQISIATGSIVFDKIEDDKIRIDNYGIYFEGVSGKNYGNTLYRAVISDKMKNFLKDFFTLQTREDFSIIFKEIQKVERKTTIHELIHTFQYTEYYYDSNLHISKISLKYSKYLNNLYLNPNFGIIYLSFNVFGYNNNYFEEEANYFSKFSK